MNARQRSALLWGVVGLLTYFILAQAYLVFAGPLPLDPVGVVVVGVAVAGFVTVVAYAVEYRLMAKGRS